MEGEIKPDVVLDSGEVQLLRKEMSRFTSVKHCRPCQLIFGFSLFLFLLAITFFLFTTKGVPPNAVISVSAIPRDTPLTRNDEVAIMGELRAMAATEEHGASTQHTANHEKSTKVYPVVVLPSTPAPTP